MFETLQLILRISRPRFWLYLAGPFLIGFAFGTHQMSGFFSPHFWIYFFYFLVPANIFLYGVNDLADGDTDHFNEKKGTYENRLQKKQKKILLIAVLISTALSFIFILTTGSLVLSAILFLLLCFSYAYSCMPFRWKAHPFIDSLSNILYLFPGLFGYYFTAHSLPPLPIFLACASWTTAMHLFSAIPDITADAAAQLQTTAVTLGKTKSLLLCTALWCMTAVILVSYSFWFMPLFLYCALPLLTLLKKISITKIYRVFPYITTLLGFLLFWYSVLQRFL